MGYSHKYKFIYFRLEKTAGTSIEQFIKYLALNDYTDSHHVQASVLRDNVNKSNPQNFKNYLRFSVTRNPWERVFSHYLHRIRHNIVHKINQNYNPVSISSLKLFIQETFIHHPDKIKEFCLDQIDNKIVGNYYIRFTHLQSDFNTLLKVIGITKYITKSIITIDPVTLQPKTIKQRKIVNRLPKSVRLPHLNSQRPRKKQTNTPNSNSYHKYYDDELKDIVYNLFKTEIDFFGYTFNNRHPTKNYCCKLDT